LEQRKISKKVVLDFNHKLLSKIPKNKLKVYLEVMALIDQMAEDELQKLAQ
jgi:hypothetical protein